MLNIQTHTAAACAGRPRRKRRAACCGALPDVMVNGVTGRTGLACAEAALRRGLQLVPVAFSGTSAAEG